MLFGLFKLKSDYDYTCTEWTVEQCKKYEILCVQMATEALARATYDLIAEENDGGTNTQIAEQLRRESEVVDNLREQVKVQTDMATDNTEGITTEDLLKAADPTVQDVADVTQSAAMDVMEKQGGDTVNEQTLQQTSDSLNEAADSLEVVDSVTMRKKLDSGVAAHAMQEQAGSSEFSAQAVKGEDGLPDEVKMRAYDAHEKLGHEQQKKADTASVDIEKKDGSTHTVTAQAFGEFDAISKQLRVEPSTEADLVPQYRGEFYNDILALGIDPSETEKLAHQGKLQEFGRKATEKQGTVSLAA